MARTALTRKARPGRMRITLVDDPAGSVPLVIPPQRAWPAAVVCGIMFAIFLAIEISTIRGMVGRNTETVFDIASLLFQGFWVVGWSVGVVLLFALTVLLGFYRESARVTRTKLIHAPRIGPLRFVAEYELAEIRNLRVDGVGADQGRIRFEYGNGGTALGNQMPRTQAEQQVRTIQAAIDKLGVSPAGAPERERVERPEPSVRMVEHAPPDEDERSLPVAALITANVVPIVGVLFLGWDLAEIMVLFWAENAIIGFYNLLKLAVVGKWAVLFVGPFFLGHFGGFMAAHFLFIYYFFVRGISAAGPEPAAVAALSTLFVPLWPALLSLFASHGFSFVQNFIGRREYVGRKVSEQMAEPYKRVILLHVTIIFGGWAIMLLGQPVAALVVLVALKTVMDLRAHRKEHRPSPLSPLPYERGGPNSTGR